MNINPAKRLALLLLGLLAWCAFPAVSVAQSNFNIWIEQVRGASDTLWIEVYLESILPTPPYHTLGNSNFPVNITAGGAGLDWTTATLGLASADSGVFSGSYATDAYNPIHFSANPVLGFMMLTVSRNTLGPPTPVTLINVRQLVGRMAIRITDCAATNTATWRSVGGTIRDFNLVFIKPFAIPQNPPANFPLGAVVSGPATACSGNQTGYNGNGPGNWQLLTSIGSVFSGTFINTDTVSIQHGNPLVPVQDTLILMLGACTDTQFVSVNPNQVLTFSPNVCSDGGGYTITTSGAGGFSPIVTAIGSTISPASGVGPFTYSPGSTATQVEDSLFFTILGTGCVDTAVITVNPLPLVNISGMATIATGTLSEPYDIVLQTGVAYTWSVSDDAVIASIAGSDDTAYVDFPAPGPDSVFVLAVDGLTGCASNDTMAVTVVGCPAADVIGDTVVCEGATNILYAIAQPTTTWQVRSSIGSVIVPPGVGTLALANFGNTAVAVTDTIIATFASGACTDTQFVLVSPQPLFASVSDTALCQNDTLTLHSTHPGNWALIRNGLISQLAFNTSSVTLLPTYATPLDTDTVAVYLNGCVHFRRFTINPLPAASISGPDTVLLPAGVQTYATPAGPYTYTWTTSSVGASISPSGNSAGMQFVVSGFDSVFVQVIDNSSACASRDTFEVDIFDCLANAGTIGNDTTICAGDWALPYIYGHSGTLIQWQDSSDVQPVWTDITGFFANSQVLINLPVTDTTYYRAIVSNSFCSDTSNVMRVTLAQAAIAAFASADADSICANDSTRLTLPMAYLADSIRWQISTNGFLWNTLIGRVGDTVFTGPLAPGIWYFRAEFITGCDGVFSNALVVHVFDSTSATFAAFVPDTVCSSAGSIALTASGSGGSGLWTTTGVGGFVNNQSPVNTYFIQPADGDNNLNFTWTVSNPGCPPSAIINDIFIEAAPDGASPPVLSPICQADATPPLGASLITGNGTWGTLNGLGVFTNPALANTTYESALADGGQDIILVWVVTNGNYCADDSNFTFLEVGTQPQGNFSQVIQNVCAGNSSVLLQANLLQGSGAWASDGQGILGVVDDTTAIYNSVLADADSVITIYYIISSGSCQPEVFQSPMVVDSASFGVWTTILDTICAGSHTIPLGAVAIKGSGRWETNGVGYFYPDSLDPNAQYYTDTLEAGSDVTLYWIVENGACSPDTVQQAFHVRNTFIFGTFDGPLADLCVSNATPALGATLTYGTGEWLSSLPGTFSNPTNPNSTFQPDPSIGDDDVVLTWRISAPGCTFLDLNQIIHVDALPAGAVGPSTLSPVCLGDTSVLLFGSVGTGDTAYWNSTGAGFFIDAAASVTNYVTHPADGGTTVQICYVIENGVCPNLHLCRPLNVNFRPGATFPGPVASTCAGSVSSPLNATAVDGSGEWSCTNCTGTFSDVLDPNAFYNSDLTDANETVNLIWTVSSPGCPDSVLTNTIFVSAIIIDGNWTVPPQPVCQSALTDTLGAVVTNGVFTWSSTGAGSFINSTSDNLAQYSPTPADYGDTISLSITITDTLGTCNSKVLSFPLVVDIPGDGLIVSPNDTICYPDTSALMSGVTVYGTSVWETNASFASFFMPPSGPSVRFVPGPTDAGLTLDLYWVTTTSACPNDTDTVRVRVDSPPTGSFFQTLQPICAGSQTPPLNGQAIIGSGLWSSSGAGYFLPAATNPNAVYVSDPSDAGDTLDLHWVVTNGICPADSNTRTVAVRNVIIDGGWSANPSPVICCTDSTLALGATLNIGLGVWSTSGLGFFLPSASNPNARYYPIGTDCGDTVQLTWSILDSSGLCLSAGYTHDLVVNNPGTGGIASDPQDVCVGDTSGVFAGIATSGVGSWACPTCSGSFTDSVSNIMHYVSAFADTAADPLLFTWQVSVPGCAPTNYTASLVVNDSSQGFFPPIVPDSICAGLETVPFGASPIYGTFYWACENCDGGFKYPLSGNAEYISTANDGGNTVTINFITQNGVCPPDTASQPLYLYNQPAGAFAAVLTPFCEGTMSSPLGATVIHGNGFWTNQGGTGTFTAPNNPNASYISAAGDGDTTVFALWNVTNPTCDTVSYLRALPISPSPRGDLDTNLRTICINTFTPPLGASAFIGQGLWTTSGNGYFVNPTLGNSAYFASPQDQGDTIVLTWTITAPNCNPLQLSVPYVHLGGGAFQADIVSPSQDTTVCAFTDIQLSATGLGAPVWIVNSLDVSIADISALNTTAVFNSATLGIDVTLTLYDTLGCITYDTVTFMVNEGIPLQVSPQQTFNICEQESVQPEVSAIDGLPLSQIQWMPTLSLSDSMVANPIITPPFDGIFEYRIVATTSNGCASSQIIQIFVNPFPLVALNTMDVCEESDMPISLIGGQGACDAFILFNAGLAQVDSAGDLDANNPFNITNDTLFNNMLYLPTGDYVYSALCINNFSGCNIAVEDSFSVVPYPDADFFATPTVMPFNDGSANPRTVNFFNASTGATNFFWFFDDTLSGADNIDTVANPVHQFTTAGEFTIALFVANDLGCADIEIKSSYIRVLEEQFFFPTAFSPNGDGLNDMFRPLPAGTANMVSMKIYDRWGVEVYGASATDGWDGNTEDGRPFDQGAYQYRAVIRLQNNDLRTYVGYVTLIR